MDISLRGYLLELMKVFDTWVVISWEELLWSYAVVYPSRVFLSVIESGVIRGGGKKSRPEAFFDVLLVLRFSGPKSGVN